MEFSTHDLYRMLLDRPGRVVSEEVALMIWGQIAAGLQHVHLCGMLHRDLHSGNVLVQHSAPSQSTLLPEQVQSVKLADFRKATMRQDGIVPLYTARTAAMSATAPEVMFRAGTVWNPTGKRSAHSQLERYVIISAPNCCSYTEKIDSWASGILLSHMAKGRPYEASEAHEVARRWFNCLGKSQRL